MTDIDLGPTEGALDGKEKRKQQMRRFHVVTTQKDQNGEDIKTEHYIDVAEQDLEELESCDKKVKKIELIHKIFFDHIKFFTYISISFLALVGFIMKTGRATRSSSIILIGSIFVIDALIVFSICRVMGYYLKQLSEVWDYGDFPICLLKIALYIFSALFVVVGAALIIIGIRCGIAL